MATTQLFSCLRQCLTLAFVAGCIGGSPALAISCTVVPVHPPSEAENAFLHSDYDRAATLYQTQLQQSPNDPGLTVGLAQVYLRQQKVKDAEDIVQKPSSNIMNP